MFRIFLRRSFSGNKRSMILGGIIFIFLYKIRWWRIVSQDRKRIIWLGGVGR